jgi:hypothetical protein
MESLARDFRAVALLWTGTSGRELREGKMFIFLFFLPSLLSYTEQYVEYDPFLVPPDPSNPWLSDDTTFWELEAR